MCYRPTFFTQHLMKFRIVQCYNIYTKTQLTELIKLLIKVYQIWILAINYLLHLLGLLIVHLMCLRAKKIVTDRCAIVRNKQF